LTKIIIDVANDSLVKQNKGINYHKYVDNSHHVSWNKHSEPAIAKAGFFKARTIFKNDNKNINNRVKFMQAKKIYKNSVNSYISKEKTTRISKLAQMEIKNPRDFWKHIKILLNKKHPQISYVSCHEWVSHFDTLLKATTNIGDAQFRKYVTSSLKIIEQIPIISFELDNKITKEELGKAIHKLKKGKSCGTDVVTNEMIIEGGDYLHTTILLIYNDIMDSGIYPVNWQTNILLPIFKSGSRYDPNNYRGIALSSCLGKLFTSIVTSRIENYLSRRNRIAVNQNGFKRGHRTEDNVMILKSLFNKFVIGNNQKLFVAFVDFRKFFDLINRDILLYKMQQIGICGKVYQVIKSMYSACFYQIHCGKGLSQPIHSEKGLKQGCNLSPILSNIVQNDIHNIFNNDCDPVCLGNNYFNSMSWADDLVLISSTEAGLQNALDSLSNYCHRWSISINPEKTNCMVLSKRKSKLKCNFSLNGTELKQLHSVTYLGFNLTYNMDSKVMIEDRIRKANRAAYVLRQGLSSSGDNNIIDVKIACNLFDKMVSPILLYGCCVWGVSNPTNFIYLTDVPEGGNTRTVALNLLSRSGKSIEIVSARRVGRVNGSQPRNILIDLRTFDDKLFILYSNKDKHLNSKLCNYDLILHRPAYEMVHTNFMKVVLGTSKYTSNMSVLGELGRFPVSIKALALGVKYWHNVASGLSPNVLLSNAYSSECVTSSKWLNNIKYMLLINGLGHVWYNPSLLSNKLVYVQFRRRMEDQFIQNWFERADTSISLNTLNMLKHEYACSPYLYKIKSPNMRRIFVKLRLNFGFLKYSRMTNSNNYICTLCDSGSIENITHFLCECSKLSQERETFLTKITLQLPGFRTLSASDKVKLILNLDAYNINNIYIDDLNNHCIEIILNFVKHIFNIRNSLN